MFGRENDKDLSWAQSLGDAVNGCVIVKGTDAYQILENHSVCPPFET